MTTTRREIIKVSVAVAVRSALSVGGVGIAMSVTSCGGGSSSTGTQSAAPSGLSYPTPTQATVGTAVTLTPQVTGNVTSYSVSPALPAGLSLNATSGVISGTPTAGAAQTTYTVTASNASGSTTFSLVLTVNAALAISAVSNASPSALSPISITTQGLDVTKPFTVTLANSGGSKVTVTPIRTQSNGMVVIPIPLVISASNGQTTGLAVALQIAQNNVISNSVQLQISDLPSLSQLGLSPGQLSRSFNTYQTLTLGANINVQQAIGMLPGAKGVPGNLLPNLQKQLLNVINARNIIDNIVANPAFSQPIGTANDGTAIAFNQGSVSILDRILAQYLGALQNQNPVNLAVPRQAKSRVPHFAVWPGIGSASSVLIKKGATRLAHAQPESASLQIESGAATPAPSASAITRDSIGTFVNTLNGLGGAAAVVSTGQTLISKNTTTTDAILSVASTAATVVTVGATIVAATFAAPEIAAGAIAVAAWSSLAGVAIGSAMVGHDIYNLSTSYAALSNDVPGTPQYALDYANAKSAGTNLVADGVSTFLTASGIGAVENVLAGVVPAELSILGQVAAPAASDVAAGFAGLITTTANIYAQSQFEEDINNAQSNLAQAPSPTAPASNEGFALIDGMVVISNSNGPTLSPLTGVAAGTASNDDLLSCMADANGNYSLVVPLASPDLTYSSTVLSAYDPISNTALSSTTVNLSTLSKPDQSINEPTMSGTCTDTDASMPDGDDPDCD